MQIGNMDAVGNLLTKTFISNEDLCGRGVPFRFPLVRIQPVQPSLLRILRTTILPNLRKRRGLLRFNAATLQLFFNDFGRGCVSAVS